MLKMQLKVNYKHGNTNKKAYANKHFKTVLTNYIGGDSISIVILRYLYF